MNAFKFNCPLCSQPLEAPGDMVGDIISCPNCGESIAVPPPPSVTKYPVIIHSSPRALIGRFIVDGVAWFVVLIALIVFSVKVSQTGYASAIVPAWITFVVLLSAITLIRLLLAYLRIKNTVYRVYPNKIEVSSYTFRFMGAYNNVANLAQLRQIQAASNGLLDMWFFGCGSVTLTVSGDDWDFVLSDIHDPVAIKQRIEGIAFGSESIAGAADPAPSP